MDLYSKDQCCKYYNIYKLFCDATRNFNNKDINELLVNSWNESPLLLLKLICLIRDPKNGKGERKISYYMLKFLKDNFPQTYKLNINKISSIYGRYEDLLVMARHNMRDDSDNFELEIYADTLFKDLTSEFPSLAIKWAPREKNHYHDLTIKLANILFPGEKKCLELYRKKIIVPINLKFSTVEQKLCDKQCNKIDYNLVPIEAMKKYGNNKSNCAFMRNDKYRFIQYNSSYKNIKNNYLSNYLKIKNVNELVSFLEIYDVEIDKDESNFKFMNKDDVLIYNDNDDILIYDDEYDDKNDVIVCNEDDDNNDVVIYDEDNTIVCNEDNTIVCNEDNAIVCNEDNAIVCNEDNAIVCNEDNAIVCNEDNAIV
jgi:hypothetical protein